MLLGTHLGRGGQIDAVGRGAAAAQEGMVAVQIVAAIAVGAAVTSVIFRALAQRGKREANSPKDAA